MRKRTKIFRLNFTIVVVILMLSSTISQDNLAFQDSSLFGEITVNDIDTRNWLIKKDIDGIITDNPSLIEK